MPVGSSIALLEECKALWGSPDRVAICRYECGESDGAWTHTLLLRAQLRDFRNVIG